MFSSPFPVLVPDKGPTAFTAGDDITYVLIVNNVINHFLILFPPDVATILPYVDIAVCINLNVLPVRRQQQIQDVVAVEFRHPTPTATVIRTPLQFLIIVRINPIYKRSYSYLIGIS